jgi:predicted AAA+ superfamily ATPase
LDEIQKVSDWQSKVKIYFDMYPNIKFFLTGSSSLYLQKRESLAGRMFEYKIKPLSFQEFLRFKKLDYYLQETAIYKEKIIKEFENYLFRQFIDIIDFPLNEAKKYIEELKNKIIKEDITFYFKIEYPQLLLSIFKIISASP